MPTHDSPSHAGAKPTYDSPSPAGTKPIIIDRGVAWFIQEQLDAIRQEIEKELTRDDLYEHVEAALRIKLNSLNTVIGLIRGERGGKLNLDLHTEYLVFAEFPQDQGEGEGDIELYEARDRAEALELAARAEEDEAITTLYQVIPETGATVLVFYPVGEEQNQPKDDWVPLEERRAQRLERRMAREAARRRVRVGAVEETAGTD